ncbi:MAG: hypothetical protein AB2L14_30885 [Candidatus Xenobiia bacterium LiM19]
MRRIFFLCSLAAFFVILLSPAASACTFSYVLIIPMAACGIGTVLFLLVWFGRLVLEAVGTFLLKDGKGAGAVQALLAISGLVAGTAMILISRAFLHDRFLYVRGIGVNTDPKALTIVISEGFIIITTLLSVLVLVRIFNILFAPAEQAKTARDLRLSCYILSLLYLVSLSFYGWVFYSPVVPLWKFLIVCTIAIILSVSISAILFYPLERRLSSDLDHQEREGISEKVPASRWLHGAAFTVIVLGVAIILYVISLWGVGGILFLILGGLIAIGVPVAYAFEMKKIYEVTGDADAMAALAVKKILVITVVAVAAFFTYVLGYLLSLPLSFLLFFFAILLINPSHIYIQFMRPLRFEVPASRFLEYLKVCQLIVSLWLVTIVFLSSSSVLLIHGHSPYNDLYRCEKNLDTIGGALEKYTADHQGHYPKRLSELTPQYLTKIPSCPAGGLYCYINLDNNWLIECTGNVHAEAGAKGRHPAKCSFSKAWREKEGRPEEMENYFRNK